MGGRGGGGRREAKKVRVYDSLREDGEEVGLNEVEGDIGDIDVSRVGGEDKLIRSLLLPMMVQWS